MACAQHQPVAPLQLHHGQEPDQPPFKALSAALCESAVYSLARGPGTSCMPAGSCLERAVCALCRLRVTIGVF